MATSDSKEYANWSQFGRLAKLDFVIHGTPEDQIAKIYASSRNMVEIIITVEILDNDGKKLNVTDDDCIFAIQKREEILTHRGRFLMILMSM